MFFFVFFISNLFAQNLIQNGDFSNQNFAWNKTGNFQYDSRFTNYRSAPAYSYLAAFTGMPADNITGQLSQNFFVPNTASRLLIRFWFRITTAETTTTSNDTLRISLFDPSNPATEIFIDRLTNADANTAYTLFEVEIQSMPNNRNWQLRFSGGTNSSLPTVFRIDDVEVIPISGINMNCISWTNGIRPDALVDSAMNALCSKGVISSTQNALNANIQITRLETARLLGKALLGNYPADFMDFFPNVFPELQNLSASDQQYFKLMLYLEYKSKLAPLTGLDDVSPFSRDFFHTNFNGTVNKSDAVKAILETWDVAPFMLDYDPASTNFAPLVCDMRVNQKNLGWVQRAIPLGLFTNLFATPCGGNSINFGPDVPITYGQFYVLLARIFKVNKPAIGYDDFFTPNLFYLGTLNNNLGYENGVFSEYSDNGFAIPSGGFGLEFNNYYFSHLTEIPVLNNDIGNEDKYLRAKLQPLGGGWTHSYSMFIKLAGNAIPSERILIYWPDGTVHSYLTSQNKYETKGLTDKLSIDSLMANGQPGKITIRKGRIQYIFRNIDPVSYNTLSISQIIDANNKSLSFTYINGVAATPGFEPKLLSKVIDSYGNRELNLAYWNGTNYLRSVTDPIGRQLLFYTNQYTHDLDSSADAKGQKTKYEYKFEVGTTAYRTHLLTAIARPKGNRITNAYFSRKLKESKTSAYTIKVDAVPDYRTAWSQQNSQVSQTQNNQTLTGNYTLDASGNIIGSSTNTQRIQTVYDSENRPILQRDKDRGYITKTSYDINGYVNRVVTIDSFYTDSTVYAYSNNQFGEVVTMIDYNDWSSRDTKFYRDAQGNVNRVVTNEGSPSQIQHQYSYQNGVLTGYQSPNGFSIDLQRNQFGNISKILKFPNIGGPPVRTESYIYDQVSRLTLHIDYNNDSTAFAYDNNDNVLNSAIAPLSLNLRTENTYDPNDNVINVKSPKGHNTSLVYDFLTDDLIEENDGTNKKRWRYNQDGSIDSFITKNSYAFKYLYYNKTDFPNDSTLWGMLRFDNVTQYNYYPGTRAISSLQNTIGKINSYGYEASQTRGKWNKPFFTGTAGFFNFPYLDFVYYQYDRLDRPTEIAYPSWGSKTYKYYYTYDYATRNLEAVIDWNTQIKYAKYEYKPDGKISKEVYRNGDTIFYRYDSFDQQDSIWAKNKNNQLLYSIGVKLDNGGRIVEENTRIFYQNQEITTLPTLTTGQAQNYSYELRNRITIGNNRAYTSSGAGEITSVTNPSLQFTWNQYGKVTNINNNGNNIPIEYDALGNRKRFGDTYYVVDQENTGNVVMEATQGATPISAYIYGRGLIARVDPNSDNIFYYHYDFRGSVIAITNKDGVLVKAYQYEPFGAVYNSVGSLDWNNPYQYLGKYGVQTDLPDVYYVKARYYQPSTGRFISEDPIWATNLFIYGNNDPINNIDPDGLFHKKIYRFAQSRTKIIGNNIASRVNKTGYKSGNETATLNEFRTFYKGKDLSRILTNETSFLGIHYFQDLSNKKLRFITLQNGREVDMTHFLVVGQKGGVLGLGNELQQLARGKKSAFYPQDLYSNKLGIEFFSGYSDLIKQNPNMISDYIYEFLKNY